MPCLAGITTKLRHCATTPFAAAAVLLLGSIAPLRAQMTTSPTPSQFPRGDASRGPDEEDPFRNNPGLRDRLERSRAAERQRRIVDDANRLVELTVQYRKALDAHGTATADDQKLLTQIEKLAREVKDRMKGM